MALRNPLRQLSRHASPMSMSKMASSACLQNAQMRQKTNPRRSMATVVPPVTQDATSSKGPTAMVFMNMGGPSTTGEVGQFLSRLFVRPLYQILSSPMLTEISTGRWRSHTLGPPTIISRPPHISATNT